MDSTRHERRAHFRGKARPGRVMPVRFRTAGHGAWIEAQTRNIGIGGAFIASGQVQPVGTTMTIELSLPTTDQVFALPAVVRWSTGDDGGGMGVQFIGVDVDVLLELNDYFSSLTAVSSW
ncbi:MAG TPA: PilZ domain-containing protein [Kofleriaceae bacterium]|nr:PilZ domain-containing protein [Kofleriaceae bacterium]